MSDQKELSPAMIYETFYVPGMFGPLADILVEYAAPQPGEQVIDAACGTGVVARRIAPKIGQQGKIVAVDLNPEMIKNAKILPIPEGASIEWQVSDATNLDVSANSFDLITCQQGLQFFRDRLSALQKFQNVLTEDGRLCIAVWKSIEFHPLWSAMSEVEARHLESLGVSFSDIIAPFSLGDSEILRALLDEAGFGKSEVLSHDVPAKFQFEGFVEKTERAYGAVIPQFIANPAAFDKYVASVTKEMEPVLQEFHDGDSISFNMPTLIALAKK